MRITHACVRFIDDKLKNYFSLIEDIFYNKNDDVAIKPQHFKDFEEKHKYYIYWRSCDSFCNNKSKCCKFYGAYIVSVGESIADASLRAEQREKRLILPNRCNLSTSHSSSDLSADNENFKSVKQLKILSSKSEKKSIDETVKKYRKNALLHSRKPFAHIHSNGQDFSNRHSPSDVGAKLASQPVVILERYQSNTIVSTPAELITSTPNKRDECSRVVQHSFRKKQSCLRPFSKSRSRSPYEAPPSSRSVVPSLPPSPQYELSNSRPNIPRHSRSPHVRPSTSGKDTVRRLGSLSNERSRPRSSTPRQSPSSVRRSRSQSRTPRHSDLRTTTRSGTPRSLSPSNGRSRSRSGISHPLRSPSTSGQDTTPRRSRSQSNDRFSSSESEDQIENNGDDHFPLLKKYKLKLYQHYKRQGLLRPAATPDQYERYAVVDNMVYLGQNIKVGQRSWDIVKKRSRAKFGREIARIIFKRKLDNICLDLKKVSNHIPERGPVKLASASKLELYLTLFENYLDNNPMYVDIDDLRKTMLMKESTEYLSLAIRDARANTIINMNNEEN